MAVKGAAVCVAVLTTCGYFYVEKQARCTYIVIVAGVTVSRKKEEQSAEPCLVGTALPRWLSGQGTAFNLFTVDRHTNDSPQTVIRITGQYRYHQTNLHPPKKGESRRMHSCLFNSEFNYVQQSSSMKTMIS